MTAPLEMNYEINHFRKIRQVLRTFDQLSESSMKTSLFRSRWNRRSLDLQLYLLVTNAHRYQRVQPCNQTFLPKHNLPYHNC